MWWKKRTAPVDVFVEPSGRLVEPFCDPLGDIPIGNRPLGDWQAEAFAQAGLVRALQRRPPCLVVPDNLFATAGILRAFVDGAAGRNAVLVLKRSCFGAVSTAVQPGVTATDEGWRFEAVRFDGGGPESPVPVVVDPDEQVITLPALQHYMGTDKIEVSVPRHPLMTLHHWIHILWANQFSTGIEIRGTSWWKLLLRYFWAVLRARSLNRWRVLGKLNRIGRGCDIHPTAVVEGSTLGNGVSVGPYARVLLSRLADGAAVMPGAQVDLSIVGERAVVSQQAVVRFSVLYPEAVASQYLMQQCVLGRRCITTAGSFTMDLNFDKEIRVPLDGQLHTTGQRLVGAAIGHRTRLGTGFWLAAGRSIPNDYFVVRDPDRVVSKVPDGLAQMGPLAAIGTGVEPVRRATTAPPSNVLHKQAG